MGRDDHGEIGRLADELLPSLIAKLGASGLGELEVREGEWHVRLRRAPDGTSKAAGGSAGSAGTAGAAGRSDRRPTDRPGIEHFAAPGHGTRPAPAAPASGGQANGGPANPGPARRTATSPAVGLFQPKAGMTAGTKVRTGDRLGHVDMLGVPQDVVSPADGIVGASLVEPGQAVEYGEELIVIELAAAPGGGAG